MPTMRSEFKSFVENQTGSITLFVVMTFLTLMLFVGAGIDMIRFEAERTRLQACVDNAVLAAASIDQGSNDPQTIITDYMATKGCSSVKGSNTASIVTNETSVIVGDRKIAATASASVPMFFLPLAGFDSLDYEVKSAAQESEPNMEISMILDVSGSMGWNGADGKKKLTALQEGANYFIDAVLDPSIVGTGKVGISLVPYNRQVAMGDEMQESIFGTVDPMLSNCANFDDIMAFNSLALPDGSTAQTPPDWTYYANEVSDYAIIPEEDDCRPEGLGRIKVMSDNAGDLKNVVNGLVANGSTSIHYGAKWGFGLLDPSARSLVDDLMDVTAEGSTEKVESYFAGRPYNYADVEGTGVLNHTTLKIAILMTDGENTSKWRLKDEYTSVDGQTGAFWNDSPTGGANKLVYDEADRTGDVTDWRELGWAELWRKASVETYANAKATSFSDFFTSSSATTQDTSTEGLCNMARQNGVMVFTIAYEATTNGQNLMQACATSESTYFDTDTSGIQSVFGEIATSLVKLKLTQ